MVAQDIERIPYIYDRLSGDYEMPSLVGLITKRRNFSWEHLGTPLRRLLKCWLPVRASSVPVQYTSNTAVGNFYYTQGQAAF